MTTTTDHPEIAGFAVAVRAHLDDLPADEVDDLLDGLEADMSEQAAEGAVDRGVADVSESGIAQTADDVVAVPVVVLDDGEHRRVEHPLEQVCRVPAAPLDRTVPRTA